MNVRTKHSLTDWTLLILLAFLWGTAFIAIKTGVSHMPSNYVATGRALVAALVLVVALAVSRHALPRKGRNWAYIVAMSVLGIAAPFYLISWGQRSIDSGLTAILIAIIPLVTLALAHFFVPGERMTKPKAAGFFIGFSGIVVLIGPDVLSNLGGSSEEVLAQLAVLAGGASFAVHAIVARRAPPDHALVWSTGVMLVGCLIMVPATAYMEYPWPPVSLNAGVWAVLWLGVISTAVGTIVIYQLINTAGPSFASLTNYLVPPVGVVTGMLVLDERLHWRALVALGFIFVGLAVSQMSGRRQVDIRYP